MNVFHTPETTMTAEEAEAIVRRHLEKVPETPSGPSVAEVAEVLRLSPQEVAGLLAEVRAESIKRPKRKTTRRERRVWLLSGGLAVVVGTLVMGGMRIARVGPFRANSYSSPYSQPGRAYHVYVGGQDLGEIRFNGSKGEEAGLLPTAAEQLLRDRRGFEPSQSQPDSVIDETRQAIREGRWDTAPGIQMSPVEIRKGGFGNAMRWARTTAPVYNGDDALVAEAVAKERQRRMVEAVKIAMKGIPVPPSNPNP